MGSEGHIEESRDSAAYAEDSTREAVSPPLGAVISVRLDIEAAGRLAGIAKATGRTQSGVVRDWVMGRLIHDSSHAPEHLIAERTEAYAGTESHVEADGEAREQLRNRYRPTPIQVLLVGESAPAGGTFFYTADSYLFQATREAFARAFGPMPQGRQFLDEFRSRRAWLYDLASRPANRKRGRPRQALTEAGIGPLAALLTAERPSLVVAVKSTLENAVRGAAHRAGLPPHQVHVLPFPLYQWRGAYIRELAELLKEMYGDDANSSGIPRQPAGSLTLHEAMVQVIGATGKVMPAREIANRINVEALYVRRDGGPVGYQQVLARAHNYPDLFRVSREGIELIARSDLDPRRSTAGTLDLGEPVNDYIERIRGR